MIRSMEECQAPYYRTEHYCRCQYPQKRILQICRFDVERQVVLRINTGVETKQPDKGKLYLPLDPDIRKEATSRLGGWKSAFGQTGSALGHLQKQKVGIGDLFLFFGSFRQTEFIDGKLSYVKGASDLHVIYGYLQVGDIVCSQDNVPQWLAEHPHAKTERWKQPNAILSLPIYCHSAPNSPEQDVFPMPIN